MSDELRALALKAEMVELDNVAPLEPQASATLIASVFTLDSDALYREFHQHWKDLQNSAIVEGVKQKLESHPHIGRLIRISPLR